MGELIDRGRATPLKLLARPVVGRRDLWLLPEQISREDLYDLKIGRITRVTYHEEREVDLVGERAELSSGQRGKLQLVRLERRLHFA
jgi:hypothetical protein